MLAEEEEVGVRGVILRAAGGEGLMGLHPERSFGPKRTASARNSREIRLREGGAHS